MCLNETYSSVQLGKYWSDTFPSRNGLGQGDVFSPSLLKFALENEVFSKSIRIGILVVVCWVGRVCNLSCHVRTCLSNSRHKLQVATFAYLTVVIRGINTCFYVIAICTMCESTEQSIFIKFCFKIGKPQWKHINYCSKHMVKM